MKYLIIDTSTNTASIGLADKKGIVAQYSWESKGNLSESLLSEVDKLLSSVIPVKTGIQKEEGLDYRLRGNDMEEGGDDNGEKVNDKKINGVIVYLGPGSYTGLRVGITVANTLAYSLGIPIVGIKNEQYKGEKFDISSMEKQDLNELLKIGLEELPKKKVGGYLTPFYGKGPNVG